MKKRYGFLASAALVGALCLCALPCAGKGEADASPQSLYAGRTQDADVLIDIPNLRQYGGYTCGTTCVQMLMNWLEPYQADLNLTAYEEALGTTEEAGTSPDAILAFFEENDVRVIAREKRTTDDLIAALDRGIPCWSAFRRGARTDTTPKTRATQIRIWRRGTGSSASVIRRRSTAMCFISTIRRASVTA